MSDSSGVEILLVGPAGAIALYWGLYRYYRNTDKSHAFERETKIDAKPVAGAEHVIGEVKGTQRKRIEGNNVGDYRARVERVKVDDG